LQAVAETEKMIPDVKKRIEAAIEKLEAELVRTGIYTVYREHILTPTS
jgi:hypothetical protein